nr:ATP-binding protein [Xylophilus sp. ASV27]
MRRLRESGERERRFIADAAHELRTPIAAMRINVEALQAQQGINARQSELLGGILRASDRAARLVGQLLRLMRSNAQASAAAGEMLALDTLVQERLAELSLEVDAPGLRVRGEREDLMSMVDNLIDNASKYGPPGSTVQVRLQRTDAHAMLTVADHGPGIAPALRERVFDRFFRDPDQTQTGSGLGLGIVKAVVEKCGGHIALGDCSHGPGLQVTLRLPLAEAGVP